jgi:hypothetical protein
MDCCKKMFIETKKLETQTNNMGNEQVNNNKTTIDNKTMQTQTNNIGNEHDRRNQFVLFANKCSTCNFSTFDITCFNHQKIVYKPTHTNNKKLQ